ncbi:MAG: TolC family protein, partial [Thermodesulfobacteriota bacterium]
SGIDKDFDVNEKTPGFEAAAVETSLMQGAFLKRKDYLIKTAEEEIAEEGIKYAKGSFMPRLSVEGVYTLREQNPKTSFFLDESAYAAVTLTFPLFEGGLRAAELGEARSRLAQAGIERLTLKKEIILQVRRAGNNAASALAVIAAYGKQVVSAEENYNVVFKQYKNGLASAADLIDADVTMTSAELELMRASYAYELSALELKRSAGTLLEEAEVLINGAKGAME